MSSTTGQDQATAAGWTFCEAKFGGICRICRARYEIGEDILWRPGRSIHVACFTPTPADPSTPAAPTTEQHRFVIDDGEYNAGGMDIRVETASQGKLIGRRILNYRAGDGRWVGFAFLTNNGAVKLWSRFADNPYNVLDHAIAVMNSFGR